MIYNVTRLKLLFMNNFLRFFFGTPQRMLWTIIILLIIYGLFHLGDVERFIWQLTNMAINTILPFVIIIAIIAYIIRRFIR